MPTLECPPEQAAPRRERKELAGWCEGRDSNPHRQSPRDPKSRASTKFRHPRNVVARRLRGALTTAIIAPNPPFLQASLAVGVGVRSVGDIVHGEATRTRGHRARWTAGTRGSSPLPLRRAQVCLFLPGASSPSMTLVPTDLTPTLSVGRAPTPSSLREGNAPSRPRRRRW